MSPFIYGGSSGGGSQAVTAATVTLMNAQIKELPTTGVTIVAAPGAGFALIPIHATARLTWVADYTNFAAASILSVLLGAGAILGQLNETAFGVSSLLGNGEDSSALLPMIGNASTSQLSGNSGYIDGDIENKAVSIKADNGGGGDFTGGNAGNSLKVTLLYYTVTF